MSLTLQKTQVQVTIYEFKDFASMYACALYACQLPAEERRAWDPLELELWMSVSLAWMLETEPRSSARVTSALNC